MVESEIVAKFRHNAALSDWYFMADEMVGGVLGLKGERAFEVDVWTFNRRCRLL